VKELAAMPKGERTALKRDVLAVFRRAELRALQGKADDKTHRSSHNSQPTAVIRTHKEIG